MKENKPESRFSFRKSTNRFVFFADKKKNDSRSVELKRASWSSFPLLKLTVSEDKSSAVKNSTRSQSSENIKKQSKVSHLLSKSKSSTFFRTPSTMRSFFSVRSSSPSGSSCSSGSPSSSPKVKRSWSTGFTNAVKRYPSYDDVICSNCTLEKYPKHHTLGISQQSNNLTPKKSDGDVSVNKLIMNYSRLEFPVSSLLEEEEDVIINIPKIICAHKKTPDAMRKTRKQILQELEYINRLGILPEEHDSNINKVEDEKENIIPFYQNLSALQGNIDLNSLHGYKSPKMTKSSDNTPRITNASQWIPNLNRQDESNKRDKMISFDSQNISCNQGDNSGSFSSDSFNRYEETLNINNCQSKSVVYNLLNSSSLNSVTPEEVSESEDSIITTATDDESSCFERQLEDNLEQLDEIGNLKEAQRDMDDFNSPPADEETVQLRRKNKPHLQIDIDKAQAVYILSNDRLLRRITDEGSSDDSAKSSRSTPRTPKSPAIDIDDLFKLRKKRMKENSTDDLATVIDIAQRLRLPTKRPSHIDWLNKMKNKGEARQLAEVFSPVVLEDPAGEFHLQEEMKEPTEEQRKKNLSRALCWIKEELGKMKKQDQHLARQLVHLQLEMQQLRLVRSCTQHEALLEEVTCEEEEQRAFMTSTDLYDSQVNHREFLSSTLHDIGVTRMNITNRRFTLR